MAGRILDEVLRLDDRDIAFGNGMPAWAYIVEHSIDATVAGLVVGPAAAAPRPRWPTSPPACSSRTSASSCCRRASCRSRARSPPTSGS